MHNQVSNLLDNDFKLLYQGGWMKGDIITWSDASFK